MLNPAMIEMMLNDPRVKEQMANQPSPFVAIPVEVAELRLAQARRLIQTYADTMRVHLETNPVEAHRAFMGEDPVNQSLAELTDVMKAVLTGALMQVRASRAEVNTALDGIDFLNANIDEAIDLAHEEVVGVVEASIGRTIEDVKAAVVDTNRLRAMAVATPVAEA